ncbi:MAG: hypothetical protein LBV69_02485 [Bacteroidales bacterium]|jgi:hypothetical protein|nr:hypothetical protein [Bacteroidales bacterium]
MKVKILFFLLSILVFCNVEYSQGLLETNLCINIKNNSDLDFSKDTTVSYVVTTPFINLITEEIFLDNFNEDTLTLTIENLGFLNQLLSHLFYHNINIAAKNSNSKTESNSFDFDGQKLIIPIQKKTKSILINYDYQSDFFVRCGLNFDFQPQMYEWQSWFFTHPKLKINKVEFNGFDESYFFSNLPYKTKNSTINLETNNLKNFDISFYLLNKDSYIKTNYTFDNINFNLYFLSKQNSDTSHLYTDRFFQIKDKLVLSLQEINKIFPPAKNKKQISIVESDLKIGDNQSSWGMTKTITDSTYFIYMDSSFWRDNSAIHEIIHTFENSNIEHEDSTKLFFHESLIEYMSVCVFYQNEIDRQLVLTTKMLDFLSSKEEVKSVFSIKTNETDTENNGHGNTGLIYNKTPFIINYLALLIGVRNFYEAAKDFYSEAEIKNKFLWSDFEKIIKSKGVTEEQWKIFMMSL